MGDDALEVRAERLVRELEAASPAEREQRREEARALADEAKRAGVDLCYSRATEQSPRIGVLFLVAAKRYLRRLYFAMQ